MIFILQRVRKLYFGFFHMHMSPTVNVLLYNILSSRTSYPAPFCDLQHSGMQLKFCPINLKFLYRIIRHSAVSLTFYGYSSLLDNIKTCR